MIISFTLFGRKYDRRQQANRNFITGMKSGIINVEWGILNTEEKFPESN